MVDWNCLTLYQFAFKQVRRLQLEEEVEKRRVLEDALHVLAQEHHALEKSVQIKAKRHVSVEWFLPVSNSCILIILLSFLDASWVLLCGMSARSRTQEIPGSIRLVDEARNAGITSTGVVNDFSYPMYQSRTRRGNHSNRQAWKRFFNASDHANLLLKCLRVSQVFFKIASVESSAKIIAIVLNGDTT